MWRVSARLLGKVDYPRLAPLEVYAPAALCCIHYVFVCYSGSSYLFVHKRSLPTGGELDPPNFVLTAFSEVRVCESSSTGSGHQADDWQFAVGLLLVLREAGRGGGDLLPRLLALRPM